MSVSDQRGELRSSLARLALGELLTRFSADCYFSQEEQVVILQSKLQ